MSSRQDSQSPENSSAAGVQSKAHMVISPLGYQSSIDIKGTDASKFLQSLLSNNIDKLSPGISQWSCFCNAKGRVIALLLVFQIEKNHYRLLTHHSLTEIVIKKLSFFKLRSKVEISQAPEKHCFGCSGEMNDIDIADSEKIPFPGENNFLLLSKLDLEALNTSPSTNISFADEAQWWAKQMNTGSIFINSSQSEHHLVQSLDYDKLGAVDFDKGCYTGQEIVARLHYLGKSKHCTLLATCQSELTNNLDIFAGENVVGQVLLQTPIAQQTWKLWCTIKKSGVQQTLRGGAVDGPLIIASNNSI